MPLTVKPRSLALGVLVTLMGCGHPGREGVADGGPSRPDGGPTPPAPPTVVHAWRSAADGSRVLRQEPDRPLAHDGAPGASVVIDVDTATTLQEMDGFGASLTESSAYLLAEKLSPAQRHVLLRRLFDAQVGIGLSLLRQPMGASDFALGNYSYDDTAPDLGDFSIEHDRATILPVLKEIRALRPDLLLFATPWSPPGWMKTSGQMVGGTLLPERRPLYAAYFVRFLEAYAAEGVPVAFVTPQNEPHFSPAGYPGMKMEWDEEASFIAEDLGPALAAAGLAATTRILVWDHNWNEAYYAENVLADAGARAFVAGSAFHCYGGDASAQDAVHDAHPELGLWLTECSDGAWNGDRAGRFAHGADLVLSSTAHWARSVITWNLALDEAHGPQNGGCDTCVGTVQVDSASGAVGFEAEYAATGQVSRFVARGARRVGSSGGAGLQQVAFVNPDGGLVVVVHDPGDDQVAFAVRDRAGAWSFEATLAGGDVATYVVGGAVPTLDRSRVVASASSGSGAAAAAVLDGDPGTSWTSGSAQTGQEWLALDLGTPRQLSAITLDSAAREDDFARGFAVERSEDGVTWGASIASGVGQDALTTIRFASPVTTRYLRVRQTAASPRPWSLAELELHP